MKDAKFCKARGISQYPPAWFYEFYDAIIQGLPIGTWPSIRQQPLYIRYRYRFVVESLKESKMKTAVKSKAMAVIDIGGI